MEMCHSQRYGVNDDSTHILQNVDLTSIKTRDPRICWKATTEHVSTKDISYIKQLVKANLQDVRAYIGYKENILGYVSNEVKGIHGLLAICMHANVVGNCSARTINV